MSSLSGSALVNARGLAKSTGSSVRTVVGQCKKWTPDGRFPALTEREWDIVEFLVDGARSRAIAEQLGWTTSSVSRYMLRIQNKLGAKSTIHILVRALELDLLVLIDGTLQRNPDTI